ncbi:unnamed protein product [Somion occarium]|uniref:Uncharacterized protein n=1 Tax=Somion occarium TaxID=3059160 RepID=A0ABP1DL55_9APHY
MMITGRRIHTTSLISLPLPLITNSNSIILLTPITRPIILIMPILSLMAPAPALASAPVEVRPVPCTTLAHIRISTPPYRLSAVACATSLLLNLPSTSTQTLPPLQAANHQASPRFRLTSAPSPLSAVSPTPQPQPPHHQNTIPINTLTRINNHNVRPPVRSPLNSREVAREVGLRWALMV